MANRDGDSVTELNASTGALVKVISGSAYGFDDPDAVATDGDDVWVTNGMANSVTELGATTGRLVKIMARSAYGFEVPDAITADGTDAWVANWSGQSVTGFPVAPEAG